MAAQHHITDRALRYRAQRAIPNHRKVCAFCGASRGRLEVGHVNGDESDDSPENLTWTCRPCNVQAANVMHAAGVGRLTNQYNPSKSGGATSVGEWMQAVGAITPHVDRGDRGIASDMSVSDAVAIIRATPHHKRSQFAAELRKHQGSRAAARWNPSHLKQIEKYIAEKTEIGWSADQIYRAIWRRWGYLGQAKDGAVFLKTQEGLRRYDIPNSSNPWTGDEDDLVRQAKSSRSAEELGRLFRHAERTRNTELLDAVRDRVRELGLRPSDFRNNPALQKNFWPFDSPMKHGSTPAHGGLAKVAGSGRRESSQTASSPAASAKLATYKGYRVSKTSDGEYFSSLDPDSWFESLPALKRFIDSWEKGRRNPRGSKFDKCVQDVKRKGGAVNAYAVCTSAGLRGVRRVSASHRNSVTLVPLGLYDLQQIDAAGRGIYKALKSNPGEILESASVEESYEKFHGRPAQETVFEDREVYLGPSKMWSVGELIKLVVIAPDGGTVTLQNFESPNGKPCLLTANRKGTQLYARKGDQRVPLEMFKIGEPYHDKEDLGEVETLWYYTTKDHLGDEGGEANYYHRLGEEHAVRPVKKHYEFGKLKTRRVPRPRLVYDTKNMELEFVGGEYVIEVEGIRN